MYKIVANSVIMKFAINLRNGFNVEKDEVKFGFYINMESRRSSTQTLKLKVPVSINTGKLKINNTGGNEKNITSGQSEASGRKATQEEKLKGGSAQMLDDTFVTHATEKQKLDVSFQSTTTVQTARQMGQS